MHESKRAVLDPGDAYEIHVDETIDHEVRDGMLSITTTVYRTDRGPPGAPAVPVAYINGRLRMPLRVFRKLEEQVDALVGDGSGLARGG